MLNLLPQQALDESWVVLLYPRGVCGFEALALVFIYFATMVLLCSISGSATQRDKMVSFPVDVLITPHS